MVTTLYILRHGETEENLLHMLQGTMPGNLTEEGRIQARQAARSHLEGLRIDHIVASDLRRCRQTVDEILPYVDCPAPVVYTPRLRERDWGSATGKVIDPAHPITLPDDMETLPQIEQRASDFLHWVWRQYPGQTLLVVSHGFFLRILQAVILKRKHQDIKPMHNAELRMLELSEARVNNKQSND